MLAPTSNIDGERKKGLALNQIFKLFDYVHEFMQPLRLRQWVKRMASPYPAQ